MVVIGYVGDTIRYDRRTPELSNAPHHIKQDTNSIEIFKIFLRYLRLGLPASADSSAPPT